ncbi:MAG: UDP-N-acetylmuramoyl-tripeptide--D-alanyl-D-alanine ligase [Alphaproteobacteria bacterium]|nr:MAG: UDP-N-acetylmuramoyl-tripeptide--D-alanyl-D-alanine ligase [Alphaproteobacteria bacterium]
MWTLNNIRCALTPEVIAEGSHTLFSKVVLDSREVTNGDIFICMRGTKSDGHDYISGALNKGASCIILSNKNACENLPLEGVTILAVPDTDAALVAMGTYKRQQSHAKIIAITGSFGKTSTKEWLLHVLSHFGDAYANYKSYNSFPGVPLTLANIPDSCAYAIVEIGMNTPHEIKPLACMVSPDVAIITTIGQAHLELFGTIDAIAIEKADIFAGLVEGGCAIFPSDQTTSSILSDKASSVPDVCIRSFGKVDNAHTRLRTCTPHGDTQAITVSLGKSGESEYSYTLGIPGNHWAYNSLALVTLVDYLGLDMPRALAALGNFRGLFGRGKHVLISLNKGGKIRIIDEAYNGGPESMIAAIETLAYMSCSGPHGRKIAVIGDMYELGNKSIYFHELIAHHLNSAAIDIVHTSGTHARTVHEHVSQSRRGFHDDDSDPSALGTRIAQTVRAGDVLMIKGSRGPTFTQEGRMGQVVAAVMHLGTLVEE